LLSILQSLPKFFTIFKTKNFAHQAQDRFNRMHRLKAAAQFFTAMANALSYSAPKDELLATVVGDTVIPLSTT